jgi:8-oxo-dGTP diphosphatase
MKKASEIDPLKWKAVEEAVLCFVRNRATEEILLIHKKTGLGAGLINAPGGRIEKGETPEEAAVRETREEVGLAVNNLSFAGDLYFQFTNGHSIRGYVFQTEIWSGIPVETDEADPFWCSEKNIPYSKMWTDDSWWLPHMLADRPFTGRFIFDEEMMISMVLEIEGAGNESGPKPIPRGVIYG